LPTLILGKLLDTEIFEQERPSAVDKGIVTLTLAVESESGTSEVVYSVVTENKGYYFWREAKVVFFSFGRTRFCLLNWIRVNLKPQIQINI
jgi:hypothetical protein